MPFPVIVGCLRFWQDGSEEAVKCSCLFLILLPFIHCLLFLSSSHFFIVDPLCILIAHESILFLLVYIPACFVMWQYSVSCRMTVGITFKVPYHTVVGTNSNLTCFRGHELSFWLHSPGTLQQKVTCQHKHPNEDRNESGAGDDPQAHRGRPEAADPGSHSAHHEDEEGA